MFFTISLYVSLVVFGLGLLYKLSTWFRFRLGLQGTGISTGSRVAAAVKGVFLTLFSPKIFTLLRVFFLEVLLQLRTLRQDFLRWLMHICLYGGFMLLLLVHALDKFITAVLFPGYQPTLNPFLFLRDFFGLLVIIGVLLALYRRFVIKPARLRTAGQDYYAIFIVALIVVSGVLMEGTKITSYSRYQQMVEDYMVMPEPEELKAMEAYWVKNFGLVSPSVRTPFDAQTLELGKETHEGTCLQCHSRPQSAFLGYGVARIIRPVALGLDRANAPTVLWYLHFLACWLGLAYLPFSKMFHIFASPASLLANSVMERDKSDPANIATRQVMELDACTHCGTCTLHCSVGVVFEGTGNANILPSEKIASVKALAAGKELSAEQLGLIQEGIYLCTNCRRCTVVCPVGINLQDLWFNVRERLLQTGRPEPYALSPLSYYRGLMRQELVTDNYPAPLLRAREAIAATCEALRRPEKPLELSTGAREFKNQLSLSEQAGTFSVCFGCETCTTVCPVVANFASPQEVLGLLPHQIMHACGLGLRELAFGSNMLWDCLTCYQCQEQCPQGVWVTDVLYELKNLAIKQVKGKR